MPTYEYTCPQGHDFELFQKMSDKPRARCPACGKVAVRKISGGAGLHFKGSGFYITDYGKDGKGARNDKAREAGETSKSSPGPAAETSKVGDAAKAGGSEGATKAPVEKAAPVKREKPAGRKAKSSE